MLSKVYSKAKELLSNKLVLLALAGVAVACVLMFC